MTPLEIEAWALRILDQVHTTFSIEDSRVELKAEWPKPEKAARQLAAHANAAKGNPILWLIGVDEKKGLVGVRSEELANWYPSVLSFFEEIAPELCDVNIYEKGISAVALLFYTERAPFLIKNPSYGSPGGGPVELEVPWREGRKTRTARRTDLIRLLEPQARLPKCELLDAKIVIQEYKDKEGTVSYIWYVDAHFYLFPPHGEVTVIPFHKCKLSLKIEDFLLLDSWDRFKIQPPYYIQVDRGPIGISSKADSRTIASTKTELIVEGPGKAILAAEANVSSKADFSNCSAHLEVRLLAAGANMPIVISVELSPQPLGEKDRHLAKWSM